MDFRYRIMLSFVGLGIEGPRILDGDLISPTIRPHLCIVFLLFCTVLYNRILAVESQYKHMVAWLLIAI